MITARRALCLCTIAFAVSTAGLLVSFAAHFTSATELVRLRNALLMDVPPAEVDWIPATPPRGFKVDSLPANPLYASVVADHNFSAAEGDLERALSITRHLLSAGSARTGGGIQSNLDETYRRIVYGGEGYCGDYVRVFTGMATASGIFSRSWAFSFDGFGGDGHVLAEIWDAERNRWIMLDVFHNYYVVDADDVPLSAMEFRAGLASEADMLRLVPIDTSAPPGFLYEPKAWEYYRRGVPEWYLWMGNNVFEYDATFLVVLLGGMHRALEQLGAIASGVQPRIRVLEPSVAVPQREAMLNLRARLLFVTATGTSTGLCLLAWLAVYVRRR